MITFIYFILALNLACLGYLIYTTYHAPYSNRRITIKIVSSLLFIFLASFGVYREFNHTGSISVYSFFIIIGLIFAVYGDCFLAFADLYPMRDNRLFIAAITSFSITHILFACAFFNLNTTIHPTLLAFPLIIVIIFLFALPKKLFNFFGMKPYVVFYAFTISMMLVFNLSNLSSLTTTFDQLIFYGSILFVISDIILCFVYFFVKQHKLLTSFNLLTYYIAEILLVLSLFTYFV